MEISLNPDYSFKWDKTRIVLYSKSNPSNGGVKDWCSFLHPIHAIVLGIFSYKHNLSEAISTIQNYVIIKNEAIEKFISLLKDNEEFSHLSVSIGNINFPPKLLLSGNFVHPQKDIHRIIEQCLLMKDVDLKTKRLFHTPLKITWMLNNNCPVSCIYCYADTKHKHKEISIERFEELMLECKISNIAECEVIGGDFFVKENWSRFLEVMQKNGFPPSYLSTKKVLNIGEIETLIKLNYSGVLQFSLDSLKEDVLKEIIHCPNGYVDKIKRMFTYLSEFSKLPFSIRVNTVLIQKNTNRESLDELFTFFSSLNIIDEWEIRFAMPSFQKTSSFFCNREQISWANYYFESIEKKCHFKLNFIEEGIIQNKPMCDLAKEEKYIYRCTANMRHFFVLPDGKVTICERLYWNPLFIIGDLNESSIYEVWNSEKANNLYYYIDKEIDSYSYCFHCSGKNECFQRKKRCWVDIVNKWDNNITFPDPICINSLKQKL